MRERPGWVLALPFVFFFWGRPCQFLHSEKKKVPFFDKTFLVHICHDMSICVESLLYVTAFHLACRCLSEPTVSPP